MFSSHTKNKCCFCSLFSTIVFTFLRFLLMTLLSKLVPMGSGEMLSGVCKLTEAVLSVSYSAADCEFNAMNQKYILNKMTLNQDTHTTKSYIDRLMKKLLPGSQEPNLIFPLGRMVSIH